jgi:hypothetical protein
MALGFTGYTADGIVQGHALVEGGLGEALEAEEPIILQLGRLAWLDGSEPTSFASTRLVPDDVLVVAAPPGQVVASHAVRHPLELVVGPWRVRGELPTLPGFDPGRAIARPAGAFLLLAGVTIEADRESVGPTAHEFAWVNRYAVEACEAALDLGYFFPGARMGAASG